MDGEEEPNGGEEVFMVDFEFVFRPYSSILNVFEFLLNIPRNVTVVLSLLKSRQITLQLNTLRTVPKPLLNTLYLLRV